MKTPDSGEPKQTSPHFAGYTAGGLVCPRTSAMIDFLRGMFAVLVVIAHSCANAFGPESTSGVPSLRGFAYHILSNAGFWVAGFFVISGFCIHLSIRNSLERGRVDWRHYLFARFTRIYPMAIIGLFGAVIVWWQLPERSGPFPWSAVLWTLLMAQYLTGAFPHYGQSWSLTNEVIYYLAWPLFLRWQRLNTTRALIAAAGFALCMATVLVAVWKIMAGGRADHWLIPIWSIFASSILWLAGVALLHAWPVLTPRLTAKACAWLLPISSLACAATFLAGYLGARAWVLQFGTYLAIPFFFLLILSARHISRLDSPQVFRFCNWCGLFSYPVYILHNQVIALLAHWRNRIAPNWSNPAYCVLLIAAVLALCCPLGSALEIAMLRARARFLAKVRTMARPVA